MKSKTSTTTSIKGTAVVRCNCHSDYQDSKYGKKNRVHNQCGKGDNFRCTVCGSMAKL